MAVITIAAMGWKTSQNSSRNSIRLVMVNSMHDSTYVWVHAQLGCLVLISVRDKVMVTRCSDIETSLNICTTRLPITPSTIVLSTLVDYNSFLWININTMVHIGMVGGRNSRTKSFGLRPGIGCLLQLAGLLAVKDKRAAAWQAHLLVWINQACQHLRSYMKCGHNTCSQMIQRMSQCKPD